MPWLLTVVLRWRHRPAEAGFDAAPLWAARWQAGEPFLFAYLIVLALLLLAGCLYWSDLRHSPPQVACSWPADEAWLAYLAVQVGGLFWMRLWTGSSPLVLQWAFAVALVVPAAWLLRRQLVAPIGWWRWGVAAYAMAFLGSLLYAVLVQPPASVNPAALWLRESWGWQRAAWIGCLCLLAPLSEELWYRGLLSGPGRLRGLVSSLVFALVHADPGAFPVLLWLGGWLSWARWRGGLIAAVLAHALWNATTAIWIMGA